jgi:choline kinase
VRAVILAAGRGHRLRDVTGDAPKCLAEVGGRTLLNRQIRSLRRCGIEEIAVVAGYRADDVRRACDQDVDLVINTRYESTNSLYSLWLARDLLAQGFVVLNCDVLFHDQLLWDLLTARDEDALLMAAPRGHIFSDEEMKIRVRAGCVSTIAKTLDPAQTDGENVGLAKFGRAGAAVLGAELAAVLADGGLREWLPRAFDGFARVRPLHVIETRGFPWIEIDFPDDHRRACLEVLPALSADTTPADGDRRRHPFQRPREIAADRSGSTLYV